MNKKTIIIILATTLLLGVASLLFDPVQDIVRSIIGIFVSGKSTAKLYAFIGYLTLLSVLHLLPFSFPDFKKVFITGILTLYAIGIGMFLQFHITHDIPLTAYSIVFNNGEISSTTLGHIHIGKGVIGTGLSLLGSTSFEAIDAGHAYIGLVPQWMYLIFGLVLVITTGAAITIGARIKQVIPFILFTITSFALLELSFDGGLFDQKVPLLFGALAILLYGVHTKTRYMFGIGVATSVLLSYILGTQELLGSAATTGHALWGIATAALLYTALLLTEKRMRILLSIAAVITFYPLLGYVFSVWEYRSTPITEGAVTATFDTLSEYTPIETIGRLQLYRITDYPTIAALHTALGQRDIFYPTVVPWKHCFPKGPQSVYHFTFWSESPLFETIRSRSAQLVLEGNTGTLTIATCIPRHLNVLEMLLTEHTPVIIYDIR